MAVHSVVAVYFRTVHLLLLLHTRPFARSPATQARPHTFVVRRSVLRSVQYQRCNSEPRVARYKLSTPHYFCSLAPHTLRLLLATYGLVQPTTTVCVYVTNCTLAHSLPARLACTLCGVRYGSTHTLAHTVVLCWSLYTMSMAALSRLGQVDPTLMWRTDQ